MSNGGQLPGQRPSVVETPRPTTARAQICALPPLQVSTAVAVLGFSPPGSPGGLSPFHGRAGHARPALLPWQVRARARADAPLHPGHTPRALAAASACRPAQERCVVLGGRQRLPSRPCLAGHARRSRRFGHPRSVRQDDRWGCCAWPAGTEKSAEMASEVVREPSRLSGNVGGGSWFDPRQRHRSSGFG